MGIKEIIDSLQRAQVNLQHIQPAYDAIAGAAGERGEVLARIRSYILSRPSGLPTGTVSEAMGTPELVEVFVERLEWLYNESKKAKAPPAPCKVCGGGGWLLKEDSFEDCLAITRCWACDKFQHHDDAVRHVVKLAESAEAAAEVKVKVKAWRTGQIVPVDDFTTRMAMEVAQVGILPTLERPHIGHQFNLAGQLFTVTGYASRDEFLDAVEASGIPYPQQFAAVPDHYNFLRVSTD